MRLLIVTQAIDDADPALGFFTGWIRGLESSFESIDAICLSKGEYQLPDTVRVHSLGKEQGAKSRIVYAFRFLRLAWKLRSEYDAVFVHMNQEYILIAGMLWKLLGKRVYLWRNHYAGSWLTDIAAWFCTEVFCTSKHSYTARYAKTRLMPVGVDTARFTGTETVKREPRSILFFARIAPSKRADVFIEALGLLLAQGVSFIASIYGSPLKSDETYYENLKTRAESLGLHDRLRFMPGVPNEKAPDVYASHEVFVNCSPSGMFDKTLFEAAASGCLVLAASDDFKGLAGEAFSFDGSDPASLARSLAVLLKKQEDDTAELRRHMQELAHAQTLERLVQELVRQLRN